MYRHIFLACTPINSFTIVKSRSRRVRILFWTGGIFSGNVSDYQVIEKKLAEVLSINKQK